MTRAILDAGPKAMARLSVFIRTMPTSSGNGPAAGGYTSTDDPTRSAPAGETAHHCQVHFIRAVDLQQQVKVLNRLWKVPNTRPNQGGLGHAPPIPSRGDAFGLRYCSACTQAHLSGQTRLPAQRASGSAKPPLSSVTCTDRAFPVEPVVRPPRLRLSTMS